MQEERRDVTNVQYAPYDPTDVERLSLRPGVEPRSADGPTAPDISAEEDGQGQPAALPEFDERYREPFEGLLFVGAVTKRFTWVGHQFEIRTLRASEMIEVGLLHKEYIGTLGDTKAMQCAMIAAMTVTIDGKRLAEPLAEGESALRRRFDQVAEWTQWTIDAVYEEYRLLEDSVDKVIAAMGEAQG